MYMQSLISIWFTGQATSKQALICCAVMIFGFWLGVDQESSAG